MAYLKCNSYVCQICTSIEPSLAVMSALTHAVLLTGCMNIHSHRASTLAIRYSISVCGPLLSAGTETSASLASTSFKLNLDLKNMHVIVHAYLSAKQV